VTDEPDETTPPDAASDARAESGNGVVQGAPTDALERPTDEGGTGPDPLGDPVVPAAVPRAPRPGQRVPRRATAPSPRTAPAVVVAPTPPRTKAAAVVARSVRPAPGAGDDGAAPTAAPPSRSPRVRRRTRAQRPAGSAEAAAAPEAQDPIDVADDDRAPAPDRSTPDAEVAVPAAAPQADEAPDDGVDGLRGLLAQASADAEADGQAGTRPDRSPQASATTGVSTEVDPAEHAEDLAREVEAHSADDPRSVPEEGVGPEDDVAPEDGTRIEEDATQVAPADPADAEPGAARPAAAEAAAAEPVAVEPPPARPVTVRTDSLTSPRSTRPYLQGVRETALTPSVRGDRAAAPELGEDVLVIQGLTKRFDEKVAVDDIALTVRAGSFYGIVGPNGAGKTTTMSMVTGLLRPDGGTVTVNGIDVWRDPLAAKRSIGVLPDRLRLFDRLTGAQLLHYSGALRGLDDAEIRSRAADLVEAFGLEDAVGRLVTDYSAGMAKKVALACAMIHSPRMLVLDEPFESVDPVSAANVVEILQDYVAHGGTVVLSSHGMDFIQRICDHVAIIVNGRVLAAGTMDEVRAGRSLEERFVALAGGRRTAEGFSWLHSFSD